MSNTLQIVYLTIQLVALAVFLVLFFSAWRNYLSRGARSFLLIMFTLLGFQSFFLVSTLAGNSVDKKWTMDFAFAFLFDFPLAWTIMVRELAEMDRKKSWRVLVPLLVINLLLLNAIAFVPGVYEFTACTVEPIFMVCQRVTSPIFLGIIAILVLEIIIGGAFLLRHYLHNPNVKERKQMVALLLAVVGVPIITLLLLVIRGDIRGLSPMPATLLVAGLLLYNAVFNYKVLGLRFTELDSVTMAEDLLLVINNDHIVQDFNRSTLQAFNTQVRNLVNVQLEHAFVDYPQIIELFKQERVTGTVELVVDGITHTFEPNLIVIMDQESGNEIGKRLQLHDVSTDLEEKVVPNIVRDQATNLYNQESFYLIGEKILEHSKHHHGKLALVVLGIDHLEQLEEKYSHAVVDVLLKQLVKIVNPYLSPTDLVARLNDDTLALLLPFAADSNSTALEVCFRIKRKVTDIFFEYETQRIQLTVSQGYTVFDGSIESHLQEMYRTARKAVTKLQGEGIDGIDFMQLEPMRE